MVVDSIRNINTVQNTAVAKLWEYAYVDSENQQATRSYLPTFDQRVQGDLMATRMRTMMLQGEIPLRSSIVPDFIFPCLEVRVRALLSIAPFMILLSLGLLVQA